MRAHFFHRHFHEFIYLVQTTTTTTTNLGKLWFAFPLHIKVPEKSQQADDVWSSGKRSYKCSKWSKHKQDEGSRNAVNRFAAAHKRSRYGAAGALHQSAFFSAQPCTLRKTGNRKRSIALRGVYSSPGGEVWRGIIETTCGACCWWNLQKKRSPPALSQLKWGSLPVGLFCKNVFIESSWRRCHLPSACSLTVQHPQTSLLVAVVGVTKASSSMLSLLLRPSVGTGAGCSSFSVVFTTNNGCFFYFTNICVIMYIIYVIGYIYNINKHINSHSHDMFILVSFQLPHCWEDRKQFNRDCFSCSRWTSRSSLSGELETLLGGAKLPLSPQFLNTAPMR